MAEQGVARGGPLRVAEAYEAAKRLKADLAAGRPRLGLFVSLGAPALVEMAAWAGLDFVVIDNEHGALGPETVEHMIRAAHGAGIPAIVRVPAADRVEILKALDLGAAGVQVPQVDTPEQAEAVARAARYRPTGIRGLAFSTRAFGYTFAGGPAAVARADEAALVVVHIETPESLRQLEAIAAVPGIDVLFVGPTDLSQVAGHPGQQDHPEVARLLEETVARIVASGRVAGIMNPSPATFATWAGRGAAYLTVNVVPLLAGALRGVAAARPSERDGVAL